jgi:hypothetical protein
VRGMETVKVMTPYLPDDERAQRLAALRLGEVELTETEEQVLQEARRMSQDGQKVTTRTVYQAVKGQIGQKQTVSVLKRLREPGLLSVAAEADDIAALRQNNTFGRADIGKQGFFFKNSAWLTISLTLRIFQTGIYGAKPAFCTLMPIYGSEKPASA